MSHFIIKNNNSHFKQPEIISYKKQLAISQDWSFLLISEGQTFKVKYKDDDFVCALGYVRSLELPSMDKSLNKILEMDYIDVSLIKKEFSGQFILIIKKNHDLFIFTDFIGGRNIFYNAEKNLITSSLSLTEILVGTKEEYLDHYKVFEYLAVRELLYPCWLNKETLNKRIHWLLPYEYLQIDLRNSTVAIKSCRYNIHNYKELNPNKLSDRLIHGLERVLYIDEFKNANVACSLTGGRDSRLIATMASKFYQNLKYRTAVSTLSKNSIKDSRVAKKIARVNRVELDLYKLNYPDDERYFRSLTEEMAPAFNMTITPVILSAKKYDFGFGGVYGTELFTPVSNTKMREYIAMALKQISNMIRAKSKFYDSFISALEYQLEDIKKHYNLEENDDRDYIRLFQLLITARYSSFIVSAFNLYGYQFEPYGTFPIVEIALQIDPKFWGNKRNIAGDALIEKMAMEKISRKSARILAYASRRPVAPLSIFTGHLYFYGYLVHILNWTIKKIIDIDKKQWHKIMPALFYFSNDWEKFYRYRLEKYNIAF